MSPTTLTLIEELKAAPEDVQRQVLDFLVFLKAQHNAPREGADVQAHQRLAGEQQARKGH